MRNILKISTFLLLLLLGSTSELVAQKYGYLNSQELILLLPESKTADTQLEAYQKELAASFKVKVDKFQADALAFEQEAGGGTLNQIQLQEKGAALQKRQQELQKEEYDLGQKVADKRNELLKPILDKIDVAMQEQQQLTI